jgi:hypothetical protein
MTKHSIDYFVITDNDGQAWRAPRELLYGSIYRTPDDPTPLIEVIASGAEGHGGATPSDATKREYALRPLGA